MVLPRVTQREHVRSDSTESYLNLRVLQLGMHERDSGAGVDRVFWSLFDNLSVFTDLSLRAFYFKHRNDRLERYQGERCLGATRLSVHKRLWNLRRAVLTELESGADKGPILIASHFALYAAGLFPQLCRLNHVVHFHGPWAVESAAEGKNPVNIAFKRAIEHRVYSSAKCYITLSQAFKDLLVMRYRIEPSLVHVIPGAVDLQRFCLGDRKGARERLGWPQEATIFLCVRRLVRRMGLEILLEAFSKIVRKHADAILILGGIGPLHEELSAKVKSYGLSKRVRMVGFIPDQDLAAAYQAADLSIVPSQSLEGFGLTALESLACGTPVLVTPVGGLPELVDGLARELILPDKNSPSIAARLDSFLSGDLTLPLAGECRQYVKANFAWQAAARQVRALYWRAAT
jgi:glycosyltransferase involved in cell wall biosynthesis